MCFSAEADLAAAAVMLPLGGVSLALVRSVREVPYAALPFLFGAHQLVESLVWAGVDGDVSNTTASRAALAYVLFALPFLPTFVPGAVWLLDRDRRRVVAPFWALGVAVTVVMGRAVLDGPVSVTEHPHALVYGVGVPHAVAWTGLYVVAVFGACVVSVHPGVKMFGLLNLVGLSVVALAYKEAFASLWCVYAALASVVVIWHMWQRRRLRAEGGTVDLVPERTAY